MLTRLLAASLALVAVTVAAFAQDTTTGVEVPVKEWIDWLSTLALSILPVLAAWLMWILKKVVGEELFGFLRMMRVDQLLEKSIGAGIAAVVGAARDKKLDFTTGSKVVDEAVQFVITHGPAKVIDWMGGKEAIRKKIIARLDWDEKVAIK